LWGLAWVSVAMWLRHSTLTPALFFCTSLVVDSLRYPGGRDQSGTSDNLKINSWTVNALSATPLNSTFTGNTLDRKAGGKQNVHPGFLYGRVPASCVFCKEYCKCMETQEQVSGRKKSHVTDLPHRENRVRVMGV
jgi:hypothetical protein